MWSTAGGPLLPRGGGREIARVDSDDGAIPRGAGAEMRDDETGRRLSAHERAVLRGLGAQISDEDPELARRLGAPPAPYLAGVSPLRWPSPLFVAAGAVFLLVGIFLGVGSAVLAGLSLISVALVRWARRQESTSSGLSRPDGSRHLPG